ncbi:MAG TPA: hypothetical protein PLH72_07620 [Vicinamibacterales bacterium]|nr:hypothetical protein [Vicinamibacterales bacterium]
MRATTTVSADSHRWTWWLVYALALALTGLLVHQWALGQPLWLDEQMLALNLRERGLLALLAPLWLDQSAPFGWLLLERTILVWFGDGDRTLRALPLAFGVGTIGAAVWVGRRWLQPIGAASLVVLCGLGPWLVYHALELKPYSADAFWGLALPGLAAWASETAPPDAARRRRLWWTIAVAAMCVSNGALFVAPACIVVLAFTAWRREGWQAAPGFALNGAVWLASVGTVYGITLAAAAGSARLQSYWAFAFPPVSATAADTGLWLLRQLASAAVKPAGASYPLLFWGAVLCGLALAAHRLRVGRALALVPLSMCALAVLRLVPMYERLALWAVPAMYFGIAAGFDAGLTRLRRAARASHWPRAAFAGLLVIVALLATADIAHEGGLEQRLRLRQPSANHDLNDRAAVAWLIALRAPGDVVITTHLALPAVWWYGRVPVSGPHSGRTLPDGTPLVEAYLAAGDDCRPDELNDLLRRHSRALVYLGFRFDDVPPHFDDLLLDRASRFGRIVDYRGFTARGAVAVVDLRLPPVPRDATAPLRPDGLPRPEIARLGGCVGVRPAVRW